MVSEIHQIPPDRVRWCCRACEAHRLEVCFVPEHTLLCYRDIAVMVPKNRGRSILNMKIRV